MTTTTTSQATTGSRPSRRRERPRRRAGPRSRPVGVRAGHVRRRTAPATPAATAAWSQPVVFPGAAQRPYGGWFDEVADALEAAAGRRRRRARGRAGRRPPRRDHLPRPPRGPARGGAGCCATTQRLRFEFCSGVSGVHYPDDTGRELHAVYHLLSMTHNRRIRLEVTAPDADPHIPSHRARSTRPTTGTSARPTTCSASSSTATRRSPAS